MFTHIRGRAGLRPHGRTWLPRLVRAALLPLSVSTLLSVSALQSVSAFLAVSSVLAVSGVAAHEGHDGPEVTAGRVAGSPRISAHSDRHEIVGILRGNRLTLYLDRFADNAPVGDARLTATLGDDEIAADAGEDGTYTVSSPRFAGPGPVEIVFAITGPGGDDLLIGSLDLPPGPSPASPVAAGRGGVQALAAPGDHPYGLAGATLALGVLIGLALRSRSRRAPAVAAACLVVLSATAAEVVLAHDGHDASPDAPVSSDAPQRLPGGDVFLPKTSQRLLEVRTAIVREETARRGTPLIGRVIADPDRYGLVQSIGGGRVSAPGASLPRIGQTVAKGEIVATVEPALPQADRTTIAEKVGEIDQLVAVAETRLRRLRGLAEANITPRTQVIDAETELEGLRRRREIVRQTRAEPEFLRAPVDGIVATARVAVGQVVSPQDVLFQIVHPDGFWAEALVYGDVDPGRIVDATALAPDGTAMRLRLQGVGRALQQQATIVQFAIQDPPRGVALGQPLAVVARDDAGISGIVLPREAIVRAGNGDALVWVHTAPERFEARPVQVETLDAARVVVRRGLKAGERAVVRGAGLVNQVR